MDNPTNEPLASGNENNNSPARRIWVPLEHSTNDTESLPGWGHHVLIVLGIGGLVVLAILIAEKRHKSDQVSILKSHKPAIGAIKPVTGVPVRKTKNENTGIIWHIDRLFHMPNAGKRQTKKEIAKVKANAVGVTPFSLFRERVGVRVSSAAVTEKQSALSASTVKKQLAASEGPVRLSEKAILPPEPSSLEKIRNDPNRIYADMKYAVGDLTYEIRNVSEHGMELYVKNSPDARKTYYLPKVLADSAISHFEDNVLSPGKGTFGWVVVQNIKEKKKISLELYAVGGDDRKETVKLKW